MQPTTDGLGIAIGLGLPITDKLALNDDPQHQKFTHFGTLGLGHPNLNHQLRWPYSTRYRSSVIGTQYDSSSTLSSSSSASSSSDSEFSLKMRRQSGSATRDVLLSYYFSPTLSDASSAEGEEREGGARDKVYLLSKGLKNPKYRRSKSETFRYLLPPSKVGGGGVLKSALRSTSKGVGAGSPALRGVGAGGWRRALPQLSPAVEEEVEARQGWSPYSSVAPPRVSLPVSIDSVSPPPQPPSLPPPPLRPTLNLKSLQHTLPLPQPQPKPPSPLHPPPPHPRAHPKPSSPTTKQIQASKPTPPSAQTPPN